MIQKSNSPMVTTVDELSDDVASPVQYGGAGFDQGRESKRGDEFEPTQAASLAGSSFSVTAGLPEDWPSYTADGPAPARARWIEFGQSWFHGEYHTFALRDSTGRCLVAMGGTVLQAPGPVARRDPYAILTGVTAAMGLLPDGPYPWRDVDAADVHPCLMLMFPNYAAFPVGAEATSRPAVRRFVDELLGWATAQGIKSVACLFMTPQAAMLIEELEAVGFTVAKVSDRCDLLVEWPDFDGYLQTLPSKRRIEVGRELRRIADRGLTLSSRPMQADEPELLRLRCALIAKYDGVADVEAEQAIFDLIRKHVSDEDITVYTVTQGDTLLSFSLFIQDGTEWTAMLTGSDYTSPDATFGYFSTIYYQPIADAPARGVKTIAYGPGAQETKRRRGCQITPCHIAQLTLSR